MTILRPCLSRSNLVRSFRKGHELGAFLVSFLKKQEGILYLVDAYFEQVKEFEKEIKEITCFD